MTNKIQNYAYPHCILIADDDRDDQEMLQEALMEQDLNTHIDTVENGVELLSYLAMAVDQKTKPYPCLIILDINMPKKNGIETLKEIRSTPHYMEIPVIMYSTSRSEETKMDCHLIGANTYIHKPISQKELNEVARSIQNFWTTLVEPSAFFKELSSVSELSGR